MLFEENSLRVVVPLDLVEGACYSEPVRDGDSNNDLNYIYKITVRD